jgi:hypothetical protein
MAQQSRTGMLRVYYLNVPALSFLKIWIRPGVTVFPRWLTPYVVYGNDSSAA